MRRLTILALATGLVMALAAGPTAAQEINLGFAIDPVEGNVGDTVDGQVDVADINEVCFTTPEEIGLDTAEKVNGLVALWAENNPDPTALQAQAAQFLGLFAILAAQPGTPELDVQGMLFASSTIMAFLDLETQSPLGDLGSFDPVTGVGSTVVPDLAPGTHIVGAICIQVIPVDDPGALAAITGAIDAMAAFLETEPTLEEIIDGLEPIVFGLFGPRGVGIAPYCIFDASGECPQDPEPINGGNGTDPAAAVTAAPRFTG